MNEFLEAAQANAEMTENLINAALWDQENGGDRDNWGNAASAGVQYVNAGPGHDTIMLPTDGITTVEFTGMFNTTTIISDGDYGILRFDFSSYLDTISAGKGSSINTALDLSSTPDEGTVLNGFCPIPTVTLSGLTPFNEYDGVENADDWEAFGGGQHNSINYFDFSELWGGLAQGYAADADDVLGVDVLKPSNSFDNFTAAQLESALNYWLTFGGNEIRLPDDYFDRNLDEASNGTIEGAGDPAADLEFDAGGTREDVVDAKMVILVGKDGEVVHQQVIPLIVT